MDNYKDDYDDDPIAFTSQFSFDSPLLEVESYPTSDYGNQQSGYNGYSTLPPFSGAHMSFNPYTPYNDPNQGPRMTNIPVKHEISTDSLSTMETDDQLDGETKLIIDTQPPIEVRTRTPSEKRYRRPNLL